MINRSLLFIENLKIYHDTSSWNALWLSSSCFKIFHLHNTQSWQYTVLQGIISTEYIEQQQHSLPTLQFPITHTNISPPTLFTSPQYTLLNSTHDSGGSSIKWLRRGSCCSSYLTAAEILITKFNKLHHCPMETERTCNIDGARGCQYHPFTIPFRYFSKLNSNFQMMLIASFKIEFLNASFTNNFIKRIWWWNEFKTFIMKPVFTN